MNSIGEVFSLERFENTRALLIRCKDIEHGHNQTWIAEQKTGIWQPRNRIAEVETVIVLIDADDVKSSGVTEVWAGRLTGFKVSREDAPKGFYHVDYFERVGLTKRVGLKSFCANYCEAPQPQPIYLQAKGNERVSANAQILEQFIDDFRPEFSGEKEVGQPGGFTADCVHGRVVTALHKFLKDENSSRRFTNRSRFDLLMQEPDGSRTLFEVKTSADSQSIYTGVGQLIMYNQLASASKKVLVLPGEAYKWKSKLAAANTDLWTYIDAGSSFQR